MQLIDLLILLLASVANLSIGLLSYLKNYRNLTHKLFGLLTVSLVGWTSANYFSLASHDASTIFLAVRLILLFVVLQNTFFFLFVSAYPGNLVHLKPKVIWVYTAFSALVLAFGAWPGFFSDYKVTATSISPQASPLIGLFILHTLVSIGGGIGRLLHRYTHSLGLARNRFKFLLFASSVLLLLAPLTSFVLPVVFDIKAFIPLAPIYTLVFAVIIAYSMVKHQLLDFRSLVAKALAYFLSIGFVGLVSSVLVFSIFSLILDARTVDIKLRIAYLLVAILIGFSFQPIKHFFDRLSNRFFFRDAYDPQQFLDQLNQIFVSNIELEALLEASSKVINDNLKAGFCTFLINATAYDPVRLIGDPKIFDASLPDALNKLTPRLHTKVAITDYLEKDQAELKKLLAGNNIAVLVRLVTTLDYELKGIGYLALGTKKSGNLYSKQDSQLLDIIANGLVIAAENALRFEEIEKFNITLQDKVDVATNRLQKSNDKLQALDETKDEFISMASHQLRTPLTSVKGYLSMVLEGDAGEITEMQRKLLDQAFVSSQRMVYLIADLLNVSRLRTGKFVIEPVPTNLAEVIEGEVKQLRDTAKSRGLTLTYDKPKTFPVVSLDETKIRQVIMNFMDNAIYYTPSGGHIKVELKDTGKTIEFTVQDDGMGVPPHERHHLFTKFYRAENAKKARPDGTGLGLFMSKKVIIAQKGTLIFHSEEGKGSTFGFSFEKARILPATQGSRL